MPSEANRGPRAPHELLAAQHLVLEMIASSTPLEDVLNAVASLADQMAPGGMSCIALLEPDGATLRMAAGPSLPELFRQQMNRWRVGPQSGTCGTAAYRRERVIVSDVSLDPLFDDFRATVLAHGLRACWSSPIFSSDGGLLGTLGVYYDRPYAPEESEIAPIERAIHLASIAIERRQSEARLRASKEQFRALIENTTDVISILDVNGVIRYVSPSIERVLGHAPRELVGTNGFEWFHPDDVSRAWRAFRKSLEQPGACAPIEQRFRHRDGSWRILETIANNQVEDPAIAGVVVTAHDITERSLVEEELILSQNRYKEVFENANDIIYTHDLTGVLTSLNRAGELLTGYTRREALGMNIADFIAPEYREMVREMTNRKIGGEPRTTYELEIINKHGVRILLEVSTRLIFQLGKPSAVQGIARDITERRRFESHLLQSQKMEAIGRLAGGVAHDFNNLLTVIIGHSQFLLDQSPTDNLVNENVSEILMAAVRAAALTNQLLAFSRNQVVQPIIVDLNSLLGQFEQMLRRLIGEDIELTLNSSFDLWLIRADPGQLEQVILNLAVNARDAMPEGGKLVIETSNAEIDDEYARSRPHCVPGDYVRLTVADSGFGIEGDIKPHIFEPFFTTKEVGKGTGLGLSTVYGIVKQGGGFIEVDSDPGMGATFNVYFPRVADAVLPAVAPEANLSHRGTETILLMEDEAAVRRMVAETLERLGYNVLEISDLESAEKIAMDADTPIDLLLTDVIMPKLAGRELARRLRTLRGNLKVLFMSGYAGEGALEESLLEPRTAYLQKPFTPQALARKVRETLDQD